MQFAEALRRGKTADIIITQNETGRLFGKKDGHVKDIFLKSLIQRAVTAQAPIHIDHPHPGFDGTRLEVGRGEVPGAMPQHRLIKHAQSGATAGEMSFEFAVAVEHTVHLVHGGESAGAQGERIEDIAVSGAFHIFDGVLSKKLFFPGGIGQNVEKIEFLIKDLFSHDDIPLQIKEV